LFASRKKLPASPDAKINSHPTIERLLQQLQLADNRHVRIVHGGIERGFSPRVFVRRASGWAQRSIDGVQQIGGARMRQIAAR
jgi:hypothetical protein